MVRNRLFITIAILFTAGIFTAMADAHNIERVTDSDITGTVVDAVTGETLSGVEVFIGKGDTINKPGYFGLVIGTQQEEPVTVNTSEDGVFMFKNVQDGTYILAINQDGYEEWTKTFTVSDDVLSTPDKEEPVDEIKITLQPVTQ